MPNSKKPRRPGGTSPMAGKGRKTPRNLPGQGAERRYRDRVKPMPVSGHNGGARR